MHHLFIGKRDQLAGNTLNTYHYKKSQLTCHIGRYLKIKIRVSIADNIFIIYNTRTYSLRGEDMRGGVEKGPWIKPMEIIR